MVVLLEDLADGDDSLLIAIEPLLVHKVKGGWLVDAAVGRSKVDSDHHSDLQKICGSGFDVKSVSKPTKGSGSWAQILGVRTSQPPAMYSRNEGSLMSSQHWTTSSPLSLLGFLLVGF